MSADASYNILQSHGDGHVVLPQPVGDLSLIDSVTGFIQEAYVNVLPAETKMGDRILWAKFAPCDPGPEVESAPLILVLAYSTGVQAWSINSNGEAREALSWHQGIVKSFQFLPSPTPSSHHSSRDMYLLKRPLVALCDNGGPSSPFHNVTFLSLSTGEQVKHIKFKNEVCEILANRKCIIITFSEKIAIFDACSLEDKFTITTCYPSPGIKCNPVSLGSRGDTTARVQDITFSSDSRWVAVSSLRGTTHVFPITMYGGGIGLRTHTTPHVVNRLSRFHKSAGIVSVVPSSSGGTGSNVSKSPLMKSSPLSGSGGDLSTSPSQSCSLALLAHTSPMVLTPLAQIRRQLSNTSSNNSSGGSKAGLGQRQHSTEETSISVKVAACFASPKCSVSHLIRDNNHTVCKAARKSSAPSLFLITGHGYLIQYDLEPRPVAGLTKDKLCDDTPIDLHVEPRCQWRLFYPPTAEKLSRVNAELTQCFVPRQLPSDTEHHDMWLSQVEIITHAGPHRRLWMGPQFSFKTYTPPSSGEFSFDTIVTSNVTTMPTRSTPMNIEKSTNVPVLIETVSTGSSDQSPRFMEELDRWGSHPHLLGESQLCEDLADAMQETHSHRSVPNQGVSGNSRVVWVTEKGKLNQPLSGSTILTQEPVSNQENRQRDKERRSMENYSGETRGIMEEMKDSYQEVEEEQEERGSRIEPKVEEEDFLIDVHEEEQKKSKVVEAISLETSKSPGINKVIDSKIAENEINIVENLYSADEETSTKRNRKTKKTKEKEDMISFNDFIDFTPKTKEPVKETSPKPKEQKQSIKEEPSVVEPTIVALEEDQVPINNGCGESKKKNRKSKKSKETAEVVIEETGEKVGEVDESLFEENIEEEEKRKIEPSVRPRSVRKRSEEFKEVNLEYVEDIENNRYDDGIEPTELYKEVTECKDQYEKVIDTEDRYEDDVETGYHYDEEEIDYDDQYDEDVNEMSNVPTERPVEPSLITDYPDVQSFIEITRTPVLGVDNTLIDSSLGLKKRKNKKKKR
uniref:Breast carcinoma-amplified sequence 3 homolog n=1 Tax=Cacopsylla melanoneura TaxID=428564 RepID=A0A8D8RHJ0_9HEMI